jgi:SAM-dependent methyltransferase
VYSTGKTGKNDMNEGFLSRLRCPQSGQLLKLQAATTEIVDACDFLVSQDGRYRYPIRNGIPRCVPQSNYADNFGLQWNLFAKTQLDSHTGHPISSERFWKATDWTPADMQDKWVLDVGCGSGRFAEVALSTGAHVVALDYSSAIDACFENLKHYPRLYVVQGDIYALPFAPESFDYVYSLGVLQHTPDVAKAFASLPPVVAKGGRLCVDVYYKRIRSILHSKYLVRPITRRMSNDKLFRVLKRSVPTLLMFSNSLGLLPGLGVILKRFLPVANYSGIYPLSVAQLQEWALLDTFDMLSPKYDFPQSPRTIRGWMEKSGFSEVEILHATLLAARGRKN